MKIQFETRNQLIGYAFKASSLGLSIRQIDTLTLEFTQPDNEIPQEFRDLAVKYPVKS